MRAAPIVCPEESPSWCAPQTRTLPSAGPDAPTPAREWDLPSQGALTLFFRWRKKSVQKKASGTATPGKSPLMPIFERGSSQCRAQHSWIANSYARARSCSLFSSFKKGKAFSLRCLSPLCSPAVGAGADSTMASWDASMQLGRFCSAENRLGFFFCGWREKHTIHASQDDFDMSLDISATQKASVISNPRWPFSEP